MRKIKRKWGIFLVSLIIIFVLAMIILKIFNERIRPILMDYSISEMKRVISTIINRSVNYDLFDTVSMDELFIVSKSREEEVISLTLNSRIVNEITDLISDACEDNLRLVESGDYKSLKTKFNIGEEYFSVPSGIIFHNTLLSQLGPFIPINLKMVGNVTSGIKTEVKEYGINNSLITISVEIQVEVMVILPLSSDYVSITNQVPIAIKLIQGKVPQFYSGSMLN